MHYRRVWIGEKTVIRIIDTGLEELAVMLVRIGETAYEAVSLSLRSCVTASDHHDPIRELSEMIVSMAEKAENKAFELIIRYQPVASDLRTIKSYMKISNDFARYGRYAMDISQICKRMGSLRDCSPRWIFNYIEEMCEKVLSMVQTSIRALKHHDVKLAESITHTEQEVDKKYFEFLDKLAKTGSATSKCTIASVLVVRYLERIADHAVYICESLIYVVKGEQVSLG
jgi:phosphate transport system protein